MVVITDVVLIHVMNTYKGSGDTDPVILNLGTRWTEVVSLMPWLLCCQGNSA
jgi:hypothetical protein